MRGLQTQQEKVVETFLRAFSLGKEARSTERQKCLILLENSNSGITFGSHPTALLSEEMETSFPRALMARRPHFPGITVWGFSTSPAKTNFQSYFQANLLFWGEGRCFSSLYYFPSLIQIIMQLTFQIPEMRTYWTAASFVKGCALFCSSCIQCINKKGVGKREDPKVMRWLHWGTASVVRGPVLVPRTRTVSSNCGTSQGASMEAARTVIKAEQAAWGLAEGEHAVRPQAAAAGPLGKNGG